MNKKTVVLGASPDPARYSNRAVRSLRAHGHEVIAIGKRMGEIDGVEIRSGEPSIDAVDTVTMYLGAERQAEVEDYVLRLKPKRIIFNPGAENPLLKKAAEKQGIETVEGCTLVMLSIGAF